MTLTERTDINAYLDGELGPDEAAEIEAKLAEDEEARARLEAYARQKDQLGAALAGLGEGAPSTLKTARLQKRLAAALARRTAPRRVVFGGPWLRGGAQIAAACALVAFGWWGHASYAPTAPNVPEYVSEAFGAHTVFAEDVVRPAEFTGGAVDGAAEWFSSKIGVPVSAPDLASLDLQLVGARLLGTKEGPLAQFIYEDTDGGRYSLTLAKHPEDRPLAPLKVVDYPDRAVGYWSTPNIDFALIGKKDGQAIQTIATNLAERI
ncbi:hypothetical protein ROJ8625_00315 [Roseivivax jejudonensis]|uniref:Zinc-finger domain-containing protein n=1 Tax=Roseivivax jejudonensis TaxID=1529041 RepID=A0A1X6Y8Q1_9RHOB|nr:anti-sigma factor [Roseivivax jejudonensis]SLN12126.1 hypothetical protein ROJ8625_00315 [Roseivivax jejudonensis]